MDIPNADASDPCRLVRSRAEHFAHDAGRGFADQISRAHERRVTNSGPGASRRAGRPPGHIPGAIRRSSAVGGRDKQTANWRRESTAGRCTGYRSPSRTTWLRGRVPPRRKAWCSISSWARDKDAPVVDRLRQAGAVLTGKTTLAETAVGLPDASKPFPVSAQSMGHQYLRRRVELWECEQIVGGDVPGCRRHRHGRQHPHARGLVWGDRPQAHVRASPQGWLCAVEASAWITSGHWRARFGTAQRCCRC